MAGNYDITQIIMKELNRIYSLDLAKQAEFSDDVQRLHYYFITTTQFIVHCVQVC